MLNNFVNVLIDVVAIVVVLVDCVRQVCEVQFTKLAVQQ